MKVRVREQGFLGVDQAEELKTVESIVDVNLARRGPLTTQTQWRARTSITRSHDHRGRAERTPAHMTIEVVLREPAARVAVKATVSVPV